MRVLVTGGSGFIGQHLVASLAGHDILNIDTALGHDIRSAITEQRIIAFNPEVAYHLAAVHFIPWCIANPRETLDVNVLGTANVLEALRRTDVHTVVAASSAGIYGYSLSPFAENDTPIPPNVYGESKLMSEVALQRFARERADTRVAVVRPFNVIGPGDLAEHVLPKIIRAMVSERPLTLGSVWPQRDYVGVFDVVEALRMVEEGPSVYDVFNLGTGHGSTVTELIGHLEAVSGRKVEYTYDAANERPGEGHLVADIGKMYARGWRPENVRHSVALAWEDACSPS